MKKVEGCIAISFDRAVWIRYVLMIGILLTSVLGAEEEIDSASPDFCPPDSEITEECHEPLPLQEAFLSVFFDGRYLFEGLVLIDRDGTLVKIRYQHICDVLGDCATDEYIDWLAEQQDYQGWLAIDCLEKYSPLFDSEMLALTLTTPAKERGTETIDYGHLPFREVDSDSTQAHTSAYLNFRNLFSVGNNDRDYILDMDGAICLFPWVLEGRFDYQAERRRIFEYRDVRLVRDNPQNCTRLLIGEDQSFQPRLLVSDRIHGIKYSTEYQIQPNLVTEPISEFSFFLERDALVEVWVNDEERDLLRLPAGTFDVRNLALTAGFNEVILKITDDLGQKEILSFNAVTGPNLLAPGCEQFAYSAGVKGSGLDVEGPGIISGFYRRGIFPCLTGSMETRFDEEHRAVGAGLTFASRWLYGDVDIAATGSKFGKGMGSRIMLGRMLGQWYLNARIDLQQKNFLSQIQDLSSARIKTSEKLQISRQLPRGFGYISARTVNVTRWVAATTRRFELFWEKTFVGRWRLQVTGTHMESDTTKNEIRVILTYNKPGKTIHRSHSLRYREDLTSLRTTLSNASHRDQRLSWKATHYRDYPKHEKPSDTFNGSVRYELDHVDLYYSSWIDDIGSTSTYRHDLNVGFSLCYADGAFGMGRPIDDGFAVVTLGEEFGDMNVDVRTSSEPHWTVKQGVPAIIPGLIAYRPKDIHIEASSGGVEWDQTTYTVVPGYRGASIIRLEVQDDNLGVFVVSGLLKDQTGKPVSLQAIMIRNMAFPDHEPHFTFTNEEGIFRATAMQQGGEYTLEVLGEPEMKYQLVVPVQKNHNQAIAVGELMPVVR